MNLGLQAIKLSFDILNDKVLGFGDMYMWDEYSSNGEKGKCDVVKLRVRFGKMKRDKRWSAQHTQWDDKSERASERGGEAGQDRTRRDETRQGLAKPGTQQRRGADAARGDGVVRWAEVRRGMAHGGSWQTPSAENAYTNTILRTRRIRARAFSCVYSMRNNHRSMRGENIIENRSSWSKSINA